MSNPEETEIIRNLRSQVASLEVQSAQLNQSREETAELKQLVRELLAERRQAPPPRDSVADTDLGQEDATRVTGSNTFSHYANQTPTSPTPMGRIQQTSRPENVSRATTEHVQNEQPPVTHATHQQVSWAEETGGARGFTEISPCSINPGRF
ncbi:uncharacterized protein MELLADRAFT_66625 [Melampsora larici-populina 98AG31]|uniref:Uncharacterized protein n=1 Tax=Melampsora larici-populina (strain 98AG31 / pathotype 3-4-7) TaxID=747676 RepID=F4RZZ3_MELLP|nr:uncharacterized protein MELLADRAFT_66625 [Melampsora larici-populina 98AG31]EGG02087.1 hypothetical protein MELLADRAFT_66625 [Melampsora larici-populina 98AG31]